MFYFSMTTPRTVASTAIRLRREFDIVSLFHVTYSKEADWRDRRD